MIDERLQEDPLVRAELEGLANELEMMGYNPDEIAELMGFSFKKLFKRIKGGFKKVGNLVTGGGGGGGSYTVTTPKGSVALGPQGLNISQAQQTAPIATRSAMSMKVEEGLKNPQTMMMVAGALVVGAVMFSGKRRG